MQIKLKARHNFGVERDVNGNMWPREAVEAEISRLISLHSFWVVDTRNGLSRVRHFDDMQNMRLSDVVGLVTAFDASTNVFTVDMVRDIPEVLPTDNAGFSAYGEFLPGNEKIISTERLTLSALRIYNKIDEGVNTEVIDEADRRERGAIVKKAVRSCEEEECRSAK